MRQVVGGEGVRFLVLVAMGARPSFARMHKAEPYATGRMDFLLLGEARKAMRRWRSRRALAEDLVKLGIRPWLDVWDLVPGTPWQEGLNKAIQDVNAAAVCVGPSGMSPWQDHEAMA